MPGVADDVFITTTGIYTVTQDVSVTVASLTLGGASGRQSLTNAGASLTLNGASVVNPNGVLGFGNGTLAGSGLLTVAGTVDWAGGTFSGVINIATNGNLNLGGTADRVLSGSLNSQGLIVWTGVNTFYFVNGHLTNHESGIVEIQNNCNVVAAGSSQNANNSGTIRKTTGGGTTIIAVPLINSGTLDVQSGMVAYVNGSQFNSGTTFKGAGTNFLYNGTVTFNGALTSENLQIASDGSLVLGGSHALSGTAQWLGGTISGDMTIAHDGTLNITGTADRALSGTLVNQGKIVWSGPNTLYMADGHLTNLLSGVFEIQNNQNILGSSGLPNFNNAGTIRKSSGGGVSVIAVPLINSGTLNVQSGNVGYWAGSQFNAGTAFTGTGTNTVYTGTVTFNGAFHSENLQIASDGSLLLAGTHTLSGTVQWLGGTINGAMTVATNGMLNIAGTADHALSGALINQGMIVWSGPNTLFMANGHLTNLVSAEFEIQNNQNIYLSSGAPTIHNSGTIRKTSGGGVSTIVLPLINSGALDVQSGQISYWGGSQFNSGSTFTGAGTNAVYTGTVTFNGSIASGNLLIASDGSFNLTGTNMFSGTVQWLGGTLSGDLTIATNGVLTIIGPADRTLAGSLNNRGSLIWSEANVVQMVNGHITNQVGGLFDIRANTLLNNYSGVPAVNNSGTLSKTGGGGDAILGVPLINSGTLNAQSGRLAYANGSQFYPGSVFTGAGTNLVYTGTATFNGAISSDNLEIGGASVAGNGTFAGTINWTSGNLADDSSMTIGTNGVLNILGTVDKTITGSLTNRGLIIWSGPHNIATLLTAQIVNLPGALFDIQNNQSLYIYNGVPAINNSGTIRKSAGGAVTVISVPVVNSGVLDVRSGCVAYGAGSRFHSGTSFTGTGTNLVYTGNVTFNGAINSENLELGGASVLGTNTFAGTVNWSAGEIGKPALVTIATNCVLFISGNADHAIRDVLGNAGQIVWSGANTIYFIYTGTISNLAGATFEARNNGVLAQYSGISTFQNAGLLRKSAGTGNTMINLSTFNNTGTLDAQAGTIVCYAYSQTGGRLCFGLNSLTNFGRMAFANSMPFTGTLGVNLNGGYNPVAGDAFALITYPSRTGAFANFDLPTSHAWQTNTSIYGTTTLTLSVLNSRPGITPLADQTTDEQTLLSVPVTGSDPDPGQTVSYALLNPPAGAGINTNSGLFSWTPTEAQGPSTNVIAVQVTDNGTPALSATNFFAVVVKEVNLAPVLIVPATQSLDEMTPLTVPLSASDPDIPANSFQYRLVSAPAGVNLDAGSGVLTWTPTESQGPSTNTISVAVTDNGVPPLSDTKSFTVIVREVNRAPVLMPLANRTHVPGALCWMTNFASDPDVPSQTLTFHLLNAPPGMSIGPTSGLIAWGPPATSPPLTNTVTVSVADDGTPPLTNQQSFVARLIQVPQLKIIRAGSNSVQLSWPASAAAAGFALQSASNLAWPNAWQNVSGTATLSGDENRLTEDLTTPFRAYRLASPLMQLPRLKITPKVSGTMEVSWPVTASAAGFALQTAPVLEPPGAWSQVTDAVGTNGGMNFVTAPLMATNRFYRLCLELP